jgi:hypothetical protein
VGPREFQVNSAAFPFLQQHSFKKKTIPETLMKISATRGID